MQYPNWFAQTAHEYFDNFLTPLAGQSGLQFLQIGAFTGDATLWLCEHVLTASDAVLWDVDTWRGSDEPAHEAMNFADVERVYDDRTAALQHERRVQKWKTTSREALIEFSHGETFDFIYIDASHEAVDVLSDAVLAVPLLRSGGLLAFDDYTWQSPKGVMHTPAPAIDVVAAFYADRLKVVGHGPQVWFRAA